MLGPPSLPPPPPPPPPPPLPPPLLPPLAGVVELDVEEPGAEDVVEVGSTLADELGPEFDVPTGFSSTIVPWPPGPWSTLVPVAGPALALGP